MPAIAGKLAVKAKTPVCLLNPGLALASRDLFARLTLRELEALACARLAVLLAFLHPRIPREETLLAEDPFEIGRGLQERAGNAVTDGARLAGDAAAEDADKHVVLADVLRFRERLESDGALVRHGHVLLDSAVIDGH